MAEMAPCWCCEKVGASCSRHAEGDQHAQPAGGNSEKKKALIARRMPLAPELVSRLARDRSQPANPQALA